VLFVLAQPAYVADSAEDPRDFFFHSLRLGETWLFVEPERGRGREKLLPVVRAPLFAGAIAWAGESIGPLRSSRGSIFAQ
jgi:hypothetical protein